MPPDDAEPGSRSEFDQALDDAVRGGSSGLTALFRAFHPRLLRYLRARDRSVADDIAGETWVAVARRIHTFQGDAGAFSAWLFTIARQRLADHHRTTARRGTFPAAVVPEASSAPSSEDVSVALSSAQDSVDFITRHLSADQAEVVLLRTLAGLSAAEIAVAMQRTEGWVRVTHHRALRHPAARSSEM